MPQIQKTTSITIDDRTISVADTSAEVQQMVQYLDEWRQDEADQASDLLKTRAAIRDLQNSLLQQLQKEQQEATNPEEKGNTESE